MKFTVSIDSGNAALVDDPAGEVARILRRAADQAANVLDGVTAPDVASSNLADSNGNIVGQWEYVPEGSDPALGKM